MTTQIFSVYDSAAHRYLDPFTAPTVDVAIRHFKHAVNSDGHQFNQFPQDYTLFHCGEFDPETGKLVPCEPHSLGVAITFLASEAE